MKSLTTITALSLTLATLALVGCVDKTATRPEAAGPRATVDGQNQHDGHDHASHAHAAEGPHHGELIELGNEEYHAEILHDEELGTVTIYVLNAAATEQVPIEATHVTINAKHDGKPEQFELAASPDTSDPEGKSSRFVSSDAELAQHLDEEGAEPRLVITINGKSYRGAISHDHDHAGHDH